MVTFTDFYIKRPILAIVISLLILVVGAYSLTILPIMQFPEMKNTEITINTSYPGASAATIQGFITSPLEKLVASADGVDYLTSDSYHGLSTINIFIRLNFDPTTAFASVLSQVAQAKAQLPQEAAIPEIGKSTGSPAPLMYIAYGSGHMRPEQITEYVMRVIKPQFERMPGVASIQIFGAQTFAMRIWLNPEKMAVRNISLVDVVNALKANHFITAAGKTQGKLTAYPISTTTNLQTPAAFQNMVLKHINGSLVYLKDIAKVRLGAINYDTSASSNGEPSVFIGILASPEANPLIVIDKVKSLLPQLVKQYPPTLQSFIVYDVTKFIKASMYEVLFAIGSAVVIVIIVIFLFLGSLRAVTIPMVTIPLSLIGVCFGLLIFGFSINLLTLLAMVLAIGLVVDDAIVVVENVHRHLAQGLEPMQAAILGAREIAIPIMTMTITLAAVYAPIGFISGLTGALFKEFAYTLATSVVISGIVALTLSPMMCSRLLYTSTKNSLSKKIDESFNYIQRKYQTILHHIIQYNFIIIIFGILMVISCYYFYVNTPDELAPTEDQSVLLVSASAPQYANKTYLRKFVEPLNQIFQSFRETQNYFIINGAPSLTEATAGMILKPWGERFLSQASLQDALQKKLDKLAGVQAAAVALPSLPTSGSNFPIQFIIQSTSDYETLYNASKRVLKAAKDSGLFNYASISLRFDTPEIVININRHKAADLGISIASIGDALSTALSENYVDFFSLQGNSYQIIPQLMAKYRFYPRRLEQIYVTTVNGISVPLSTLISIEKQIKPNSLSHFQQRNAVTLQATMASGKTIGQGLEFLNNEAKKLLPKEFSFSYAGQSRRFIETRTESFYLFSFAILTIFLVLAAQFESFIDPIIILVTVPMSIFGALLPLYLGFATINIYTQIGLVTLIALISKHGILMVDFANHLKLNENLSSSQAIEKAAAIRLRPILMTTSAMVVGLIPLLLAKGAGAVSRYNIGLVVICGLVVGTFFTIFVLPSVYVLISRKKVKK